MKRSSVLSHFMLGCALIGLRPSALGEELDPAATLERLRREATPAWKEVEEFYRQFRATIVHTRDSRTIGEPSRAVPSKTFFVKRRGDSMLFEHDPLDAMNRPIGRVAACSAGGMHFGVGRKSSAAPWELQFAARLDEASDPNEPAADDQVRSWGEFFERTYSLLYPPRKLREAIRNPDFELLGASAEPSGTIRLRFRFDESDTVAGKKVSWTRDGWIEVDPSKRWVIRAGDCSGETTVDGKSSGPGRGQWQQSYRVSPEGFPILSRWESKASGPGITLTETYDVESFEHVAVPEAEFRPSAYGFEDGSGPFADANPGEGQGGRRGWWLSLGAAALFALAGASRWCVRR